MVESNKNQHTSTTGNSYVFGNFNIYDYKCSIALGLFAGYKIYQMRYHNKVAETIQNKINYLSSKEVTESVKLFNDVREYLRKGLEQTTITRDMLEPKWKEWLKTNLEEALELAINNIQLDGENIKDKIFKDATSSFGKTLYRLPSIPSQEVVDDHTKEALLHQAWAIGSGLVLGIHGLLNGFSDSNLYKLFLGDQTDNKAEGEIL